MSSNKNIYMSSVVLTLNTLLQWPYYKIRDFSDTKILHGERNYKYVKNFRPEFPIL